MCDGVQECVRLEKSRDGCPKVVNLGASRQDAFYERKKSEWSGPELLWKCSGLS